MGFMKTNCDYVDLTAPFTPLPKYGHYSKISTDYQQAEPEIRKAREAMNCLPDIPTIRTMMGGDPDAAMPPGGPDRYKDITTQLIDIPTRDGTEIELKVYKSHKVNKNAVLMYRMHGGGWCLGRHEVDGIENVYAAINPDIVVVSVDYRKAPEHPFPIPNNDCYDGLLWCKNNSDKLGVDPERIILSGGSAGGQLAASLALECMRDGITGVIAQALHFPASCHPKFFPTDKYEYGSYVQNCDDAILSARGLETFYDAYIPNVKPNYRHSPLLADSFKGLPPTLIQCAGVDPLRDDAFALAEALKSDGVEVDIYCYAGLPHWFPAVLPHITETSQFLQRYTDFAEKHSRS
ncbi:hypothetical protein ACHAPZ_000891 [Fusarium culmorum]|uniref:AB hydrolase superfamily protein B1A11.02 n=1 Tax=Fusarium culmorum TaxID=5516 RepID=A0A2T4H9C3_FUSCU|nr:AB hydrolase superfamily protein B1A11.02 [Fusarium culmorum]